MLLNIALSQSEKIWKRRWCLKWIQRINPEFNLKLSSEEETVLEKKQTVEFNEKASKEFLTWWEVNKNSAAVQEIFKEIELKYDM